MIQVSPAWLRFHPRSFLSLHTTVSRMPTTSGRLRRSLSYCHNGTQMEFSKTMIHQLHDYTSGRWLRNDRQERAARSLDFNFDALCERAIACCPGASSITSFEKREGGFSKVFLFTMDTSQRVIGRFPTFVSGPPSLTTNSEVATIKYLQSHTSIPIPKILDWSDDSRNPVGREYILMEHCKGVQLNTIWSGLSVPEQIRFIQSISRYMQQMTDLEFPAFGSLYFLQAPALAGFTQLDIQGSFCIGPHCGPRYWDCNIDDTRYNHNCDSNRGPWRDLKAFCDGLIDTGRTRIPPVESAVEDGRPFQGQPSSHLKLLASAQTVLKRLICDDRISTNAAPTLLHPDFNTRNIFVDEADPTKITAIIDWQSTGIEPVFMYADEVPDFAMTSHSEARDDSELTKSDLCSTAFDGCIKAFMPKLEAVRALDEDLLRIFRYCHRTWKDGSAALEEEMIVLAHRWVELGLPGQCPYAPPNGPALAKHHEVLKDFTSFVELKQNLITVLETDGSGWVSPERYESVLATQKAVYNSLCQGIANDPEADISVDTIRKLWPFDLPS